MIKNFKRENIGPSGYDFRLGFLFKHRKQKEVVDIEKDEWPEVEKVELPYVLEPGEFVLGQTIEEFDTPLDVMSFYSTKSTAFRIGLNIMCGINDPGYKGKAIMGIQNVSQNRIKLFEGMELLQTSFVDLKGDSVPVQTKYMGGKIL